MKIIRAIYGILLCIAALVSLGCLILTIAAFKPGYLFELASHFRLLYLVVGLVVMALILLGFVAFRFSRKIMIPLLIVALIQGGINFAQILLFYQAKPVSSNSQHVIQKIKILHINVLGINRNYQAVENLIRDTQPDILTLAEYNSRWRKQLEQSGVLKRFQSAYVVKYGNDGIYSTIPFENVKVDYVKPGQDSTAEVRFHLSKVPVTLLVVHPRPPVKPKWYERNRDHFAYWEKQWKNYGPNVLLVGDLNNSPWSITFRHFIQISGLHDSQLGFGLQPSWPVAMPDRGINRLPAIIPIDHVLYSDRFAVLSRKLGPQTGSDHLPVIVEMAICH